MSTIGGEGNIVYYPDSRFGSLTPFPGHLEGSNAMDDRNRHFIWRNNIRMYTPLAVVSRARKTLRSTLKRLPMESNRECAQ
jgi:hypothetical protein